MRVPTAAGDELLQAKQALETAAGWYAWRHALESPEKDTEKDTEESEAQDGAPLPALNPGQCAAVTDTHLLEKLTTPPKPFTEATLLDAMTGVARFVEDPLIRKVLRETDGLGTPATQATILETLFKRGYLQKQRKTVMATDLGQALIDALPEFVTLPDMTALWELNLKQIVEGDESLNNFMNSIQGHVESLVGDGAGDLAIPTALKGKHTSRQKAARTRKPTQKGGKTTATSHACSREGCGGQLRRIKGKHGFFWGCSNYKKGCRETRKDSRGKPVNATSSKPRRTAAAG